MTDRSAVSVPKWPFVLIDLLFLALAGWIVSRTGQVTNVMQTVPLIICVAAGAGFLAYPFVMDYQAALKLADSGNLASAVQQIQNIEAVAAQIATANSQWQAVLDQSNKTVTAANGIADRMTAEAKNFAEFMQKANDAEKNRLRLEVDKLRRSEGEWLEIVVRTLDHVYGLYQAGNRSGQANIIQQLSAFQNACRDVSRRIGLVPYVAAANEPFNAERHQLIDEKETAPPDAVIADTLATGFTFQGQLIRKAIVVLQPAVAAAAPAEATPAAEASDETEPQLL